MKKYHSKVGLTFSIPLIMVIACLVYEVVNESTIYGAAILALVLGLMVDMMFRTYYIIEKNRLYIRCGLSTSTIHLQSIRKISDSSILLSSPALSIDRLEILYNKFDTILVSPKDKAAFLAEVKKVNPNIEINSKSFNQMVSSEFESMQQTRE